MDHDFVQLQAILAGVPMHAVPQPIPLRSCAAANCAGVRFRPPEADHRTSEKRIADKLQDLCEDYPDHQDILASLDIVHASLDLVCLADHEAGSLFTAARGTDRNINPLTTPRDWSSNFSIAFGAGPTQRSTIVMDEYKSARKAFPGYTSYGSGHSLGGAVVLQLAQFTEDDPELKFTRVDVFNTAVSPFTRSFVNLTETALHVHRVSGDWASWGLTFLQLSAGEVHVHPVKPHVRDRHALVHFLPTKAREKLQQEDDEVGSTLAPSDEGYGILATLGALSCVGSRKPSHCLTSRPADMLAVVPPLQLQVQDDLGDPEDSKPLSEPSSVSPSVAQQ